jgi:hypothetical protein
MAPIARTRWASMFGAGQLIRPNFAPRALSCMVLPLPPATLRAASFFWRVSVGVTFTVSTSYLAGLIARSSALISRTLARMDLRKSMLSRVQTSRTITMDFKCSHDAACWATVVP